MSLTHACCVNVRLSHLSPCIRGPQAGVPIFLELSVVHHVELFVLSQVAEKGENKTFEGICRCLVEL